MDFEDLDESGRRMERLGDYRDGRGVLHCGRCGAPKEVCCFGDDGIVTSSWPKECDCESVRRQVSEAKEEAKRRFSSLPQKYSHGFHESDGRAGEAERIARKYVERFDDARGLDVNGLLFYGGVGLGKTFLAACIATELASKGNRVTIRSMADFVAEAMEHGFDRESWLADLLKCDLIVLDDLGVERSTDTAFEIVFHVVDSAVRSRKPMVVTTNLDMLTLTNPGRIENARIYSRVLGCCLPVEVKSDKGRISVDKMAEALKLYTE